MTADPTPYYPPPPGAEPMRDYEAEADPEELQRIKFNQRVAVRAEELRILEQARARLAREKLTNTAPPDLTPLDQFLATDDEPTAYVVDEVWPTGGRVLLAAQFKAGKTTMVGNLLRSLADAQPFLDRFTVPAPRRVVLIDDELDPRTLRRWLRDQDVTNRDHVRILTLRGRLGTFDIRDDEIRAHWARQLAGADVVILDCLRPLLDALGLDENRESGRFLVPFDALLHEAGASEALVVHHMGHRDERGRGDSRLQDWPDAGWKLVRDKDDDNPALDDVTGSRYFSAFGRDVNVPQAELTYDESTRHLSLGEQALNRRDATAHRRTIKAEEAVLAAVHAQPGINVTKLRHDVRTLHAIGRNEDIDSAAERLVQRGLITRIPVGNMKQHYPGEQALLDPPAQLARPAPTPPGHMGRNMPARPIGAGIPSHTPHDPRDTCPHGMPNGHKPDDFVNGRLSCPQCAKEAM